MPGVGSLGNDPFKQYGWVIIVAAVLVGLWLATSNMSGTGSGSVEIADSLFEIEQTLQSLDSAGLPKAAPGGAYARRAPGAMSSSLYQAPAGAAASGAPVSEKTDLKSAAGKDSAAKAMSRVAKGGSAGKGWGGKSVRTGFSRPKAKFGKVGRSRSGGGSSSSASMKYQNFFGLGGEPGLNLSGGSSFSSAGGKARRRIATAGFQNRSLRALKGVNERSRAGLNTGDELAAGFGRKAFDASDGSRRSLAQLASQGASGLSDSGVPANLKATDMAKINEKKFEPPEIEGAKEVDDNKEYMKQKIMMMVLAVAIAGIVGPVAGAMSGMILQGMGMTQGSPGSDNRVEDQ